MSKKAGGFCESGLKLINAADLADAAQKVAELVA